MPRQTRRTCISASSSSTTAAAGGRAKHSIRTRSSTSKILLAIMLEGPRGAAPLSRPPRAPSKAGCDPWQRQLILAASMLGRRSSCLTSAAIAGAIVAAAATLVLRADDRSRRDPEVSVLVADTDLVAPDFAADALIRLSTSPRITDPAWRLELLDQAFDRTYAAQEPYRRASPHGIIPPDSRQGADLFAFETARNRVTLQVRIAQTMAALDPRRGRERFEWIDLNLAPGRCEDPLVASVDDYYTALALLARTSFADRGEALRFLQLYLWRAHLPSEMPAVV